MNHMISTVLGFAFGIAGMGVAGIYLYRTRTYRKARNRWLIGLGYLVVGGAPIGSLLLLREATQRVGLLGRPEGTTVLHAWMVGFLCVAAPIFWSEFKWQRSVVRGQR